MNALAQECERRVMENLAKELEAGNGMVESLLSLRDGFDDSATWLEEIIDWWIAENNLEYWREILDKSDE